ncbi:MAG TPA: hypothetical protein VM912_03245 [Terriglobales bacterium]|nr:hypothetical protein [Terriglobales bacterium]
MKRQLEGLSRSAMQSEIADGLYLVRVQRAHYRWHKQKSFYEIHFYVLEPQALTGAAISTRISCAPKSLWKLAWFLRDFRYSHELLERDEIDTKALVGLQGVIQVGHEATNGCSEVILKAFAPTSDWPHLMYAPNVTPEVA